MRNRKTELHLFALIYFLAFACAVVASGAFAAGCLPFSAMLTLYGLALEAPWCYALLVYARKMKAKQKRTEGDTSAPSPSDEEKSGAETCEDCAHLGWFGDYSLHYCDVTKEQVEKDTECRHPDQRKKQ